MRSIEKYFFTPIAEDKGWKLYKRASLHGRTLIMWFNPTTKIINICIFNYLNQPNELSKSMSPTEWGYPTYFINDINNLEEASDILDLYLKDFRDKNFWWEEDGLTI